MDKNLKNQILHRTLRTFMVQIFTNTETLQFNSDPYGFSMRLLSVKRYVYEPESLTTLHEPRLHGGLTQIEKFSMHHVKNFNFASKRTSFFFFFFFYLPPYPGCPISLLGFEFETSPPPFCKQNQSFLASSSPADTTEFHHYALPTCKHR